MNKRLLGGIFVATCSVAALALYMNRTSNDPDAMRGFTAGEQVALSTALKKITSEESVVIATTQDMSEYVDEGASKIAPLDEERTEDADVPISLGYDKDEDTVLRQADIRDHQVGVPHDNTDYNLPSSEPFKLKHGTHPAERNFLNSAAMEEYRDSFEDTDPFNENDWIDVTNVVTSLQSGKGAPVNKNKNTVDNLSESDDNNTHTSYSADVADNVDIEDIPLISGQAHSVGSQYIDVPVIKDSDVTLSPNNEIDDRLAIQEVPLSNIEQQWAKLKNKDLVYVFDSVTGYPQHGIEGEVSNMPFMLPFPTAAPGDIILRPYQDNEHLPSEHPGWCMTAISLLASDNKKYFWIHEGSNLQGEGRAQEISAQLSEQIIDSDSIYQDILEDGEKMEMFSACFDGVWEGVSPLEHGSLMRVLADRFFPEGTVIQK